MRNLAELDLSELRTLHSKLTQSIDDDILVLLERTAKKIAQNLWALTVEKTPKKSGLLSDSWQVSVDKEGSGDVSILIQNNVLYAPYVEYGHRKGKEGIHGWQNGSFMLTLSARQVLEHNAPAIIRRELEQHLEMLLRN